MEARKEDGRGAWRRQNREARGWWRPQTACRPLRPLHHHHQKFIAGDPDKDVAVLQLDAPPDVIRALRPVTVGASAGLQVGQKVFAIGNPFGLDHTLTQGIVSGLGRELATPGPRGVPIKNVIQTDAAINPGNSGGVLLDSRGRLVGINTAIADPTGKGASSGVGFAIPIDTVRGLVDQILTYGRVVRPVLGVTVAPPQTLRQLGEEGVLVLDVPAGTPAAKAGLKGTFRRGRGCGRGRSVWTAGRGGSPRLPAAHSPAIAGLPPAPPLPTLSRDQTGRLVLGDIITGIDSHKARPRGRACGRTRVAMWAPLPPPHPPTHTPWPIPPAPTPSTTPPYRSPPFFQVASQRDLFEALDERRPGDRVAVSVTRGGRSVALDVTLGGRGVGAE